MAKKDKEKEFLEDDDLTAGAEGIDDVVNTAFPEEPETTGNDNLADESFENSDMESQLNEELKECQDKFLRLQADFDNFRKRTLKEKMELIDSAGSDVIKSILPVADDMDRAIEAMKSTDEIEAVRQGIELIYNKLKEMLNQRQVKEIVAMGKPFDTDFHDAIARVPVDDENKKGKIIDVIEKGYVMKDKVIRFSKVVVGE